MEPFHYRDGQLYCEDVPAAELAERFGTPLYVYSQASILGTLKALQSAFAEVDPLICYSVKANSNLGILKVMAEHGSGFDVVSAGELYRVGLAGGDPAKTVFAGVGKTDEEIQRRARGRRPDVQRRERGRARRHRPRGRLDRQGRPDRAARQSRRRPQDPPVHLDRQEGVEVRHGHRAGRADGAVGRRNPFRPHDRHAHAHRLADYLDRAVCGCRCQGCRADRPAAGDGPSDRLVQHGGWLRHQL